MLLRKCIICNVIYGCVTKENTSVCQQCADDDDCKGRDNLHLLGDEYITEGICSACQPTVQREFSLSVSCRQ